MDKCVFCLNTRFNNNKLVSLPAEESILFENDKLYVIPDIAPLKLGHILIITNEHYTNFFSTPIDIKKDVKKLQNNIRKLYKRIYNSDTLFFEHGSLKAGDAGSSIEHAHLHAIPFTKSIKKELDKIVDTSPIKCNIINENNFSSEYSYLYIENENDGNYIYKVDKLPSQFLRKFVASLLDSKVYTWQNMIYNTEDNKETYNRTIEDIKNHINIEESLE